MDKRVAVKVSQAGPHDFNAKQRFLREAKAAREVRHQNLCPIHDVDEQNGIVYMVMPYLTGPTLAQLALAERPMEVCRAVELVLKLTRAMEAAHKAGVYHRDLKPSNVLFDDQDEPVISDYGLAYFPDSPDTRLTDSKHVVGTVLYAAPEQLRHPTAEPQLTADVYSMGVILYELLTGQLPFEGGFYEVVNQVLQEDLPAPSPSQYRSELDAKLVKICQKAIAKKADERYATMAEFAEALTSYLNPPIDLPMPPPPRGPWAWLATAVLGLVVVGGVYYWPRPTAPIAQTRPLRSSGDVLARVLDHLEKRPPAERQYWRYVSLAMDHNNPAVDADYLDKLRTAVGEVLATLVKRPGMPSPVPVDAEEIVLAIDLRALSWNDATWRTLLHAYPYGLKLEGPTAEAVYKETNIDVPVVRADWLVAAASTSPLVEQLQAPMQPALGFPKSVTEIKQAFYNTPLDLEAVCRELGGSDAAAVRKAVEGSANLKAAGLDKLLDGGTITRAEWEALDRQEQGITPYRVLCRELKLGIPRRY